jgi:hypothetical protein
MPLVANQLAKSAWLSIWQGEQFGGGSSGLFTFFRMSYSQSEARSIHLPIIPGTGSVTMSLKFNYRDNEFILSHF